MEDSKDHDHTMDNLAKERGFMTESEMIDLFAPELGPIPKKEPEFWAGVGEDKWYKISMWYSKTHHDLTFKHHEKVPPGMIFSCDDLADIWIERWLKTPKDLNPFTNPASSNPTREKYSDMDANSLVLANDKADVYLVSASAFQNPDFRRVLMFREASVLVPVYFSMASDALFPSREKSLLEDIEKDLKGVKLLQAKLDGDKLYGCTVVRNKPLRINNIPKNNIFDIPEDRLIDRDSMNIYHGGFWVLTRKLTPGDHLLYFQSISKNYEMEVKMLITVLA